MDDDVERTKFWSFCRLSEFDVIGRETKGFAYHADGNVYVSGFINGSLGCEFNVFRRADHSSIRRGLITTTSVSGMPVAKQCVLIEANETIFKDTLCGHKRINGVLQPINKNGDDIRSRLTPIQPNKVQEDIVSIPIPIMRLLQEDETNKETIRILQIT